MASAIDNYLTDPTLEIYHLLSGSSIERSNSINKMSTPITNSEQIISPTELCLNLPAPILSLIVRSSTIINSLSIISLTIRWSHPKGFYPSWLLLFSWFTICLIIKPSIRFGGLNIIFIILLGIGWVKHINQNPKSNNNKLSIVNPLEIHNTLISFQILVDHLDSIIKFLNPLYDLLYWKNYNKSKKTLFALLTSLPFTILFINYITINNLSLLIGTIFLICESPWFKILIRLINCSRTLKFIIKVLLLLFIFGGIGIKDEIRKLKQHRQLINLWSKTLNEDDDAQSDLDQSDMIKSSEEDYKLEDEEDEDQQVIKVRFTIFENQRWWMGLDWTSTLLPHERSNWTDSTNKTVSGPTEFQLPKPTITSSQRKVEWKWLDKEWRICKASPGVMNNSPDLSMSPKFNSNKFRSVSSLKPIKDLIHSSRSSSSRIGSSINSNSVDQSENDSINDVIQESLLTSDLSTNVIEGEDPNTPWDVDSSGWQYGDNHWEKLSRKAGIGRYTRRRAWVRRAIMVSKKQKLNNDSIIIKESLTDQHSYSTALDKIGITKAIQRST
ncbi:hypothetical protein CROQUDRAFT_725298 [Cronartium quercuum f. sp. fusiforme G11]|uniref:Peroxin/Ferlin domain-containing protein n=1 Tax=Cronartium quercuum f. sp. fusiforme G11 TaxID=708437 RepID=A0A9P6NAN2_9BASI|nr:hypothetical protein CROQUDRAFT_725298 [Cronartium quercuum f. sp. fusiforme G11]